MKAPSSWKSRVAGVLLIIATIWYLPWLIQHINRQYLWLGLPFAAASILVAALTMVTVINHWTYSAPPLRPVKDGQEPEVAIIIPTYGEPVEMVERTVRSVLKQDYPRAKISLIISDDGHRPDMHRMVERLQEEYGDAFIAYHEPPFRGDPTRHGEAKSGNLNSALEVIDLFSPAPLYVETRDADDLVVDHSFLRQTIGQLEENEQLAFVQTIKEADVSPGDPFGNQEPLFYRNAMLARNAANAVFPCGSGLVWRRAALDDIGGFPTWNLVEDLQSGLEALRRGWHGLYLPIVGARGQTAPEDLPNTMKQRGTWAIDTMRLTFWGKRQGLSLRQHIQFAELGLFYLSSFAILTFLIVPIISLITGWKPLDTDSVTFLSRLLPYAAAIELMLIALSDGMPYETLWRARQIWLGMTPVYIRATLSALINGPKKKPSYRVTRKRHIHRWYWREALAQTVLLIGLWVAVIYHLTTRSLLYDADLGTIFWAVFLSLCLARIVTNSWYGLELHKRATYSSAQEGAGES
jgi:cellulose synthase (UDP-forming)